MKYISQLINAPWEDPGIIVSFSSKNENLLFDCGDIVKIGVGAAIRTSRVFVTHTHIDHFIGFDYLLRMNLRENKELKLYGPAGLAAQIAHRLQGYSWNLTEDSRYTISCCDLPLSPDSAEPIRYYAFPAAGRFREDVSLRREIASPPGELYLEDGALLRFAPVVHGLDCLCYSLTEPPEARLREEELKSSGLPPGPWIKELLSIYSLHESGERLLQIGDKQIPAASLRSLIKYPKQGKIAYVTDTVFNRQSVKSARFVGQDADVLWCEACYLHNELEKAKTNLHMTARQAGRLAKELNAGELRLFHYSRRYKDSLRPHIEEAKENFANTVVPPSLSEF